MAEVKLSNALKGKAHKFGKADAEFLATSKLNRDTGRIDLWAESGRVYGVDKITADKASAFAAEAGMASSTRSLCAKVLNHPDTVELARTIVTGWTGANPKKTDQQFWALVSVMKKAKENADRASYDLTQEEIDKACTINVAKPGKKAPKVHIKLGEMQANPKVKLAAWFKQNFEGLDGYQVVYDAIKLMPKPPKAKKVKGKVVTLKADEVAVSKDAKSIYDQIANGELKGAAALAALKKID